MTKVGDSSPVDKFFNPFSVGGAKVKFKTSTEEKMYKAGSVLVGIATLGIGHGIYALAQLAKRVKTSDPDKTTIKTTINTDKQINVTMDKNNKSTQPKKAAIPQMNAKNLELYNEYEKNKDTEQGGISEKMLSQIKESPKEYKVFLNNINPKDALKVANHLTKDLNQDEKINLVNTFCQKMDGKNIKPDNFVFSLLNQNTDIIPALISNKDFINNLFNLDKFASRAMSDTLMKNLSNNQIIELCDKVFAKEVANTSKPTTFMRTDTIATELFALAINKQLGKEFEVYIDKSLSENCPEDLSKDLQKALTSYKDNVSSHESDLKKANTFEQEIEKNQVSPELKKQCISAVTNMTEGINNHLIECSKQKPLFGEILKSLAKAIEEKNKQSADQQLNSFDLIQGNLYLRVIQPKMFPVPGETIKEENKEDVTKKRPEVPAALMSIANNATDTAKRPHMRFLYEVNEQGLKKDPGIQAIAEKIREGVKAIIPKDVTATASKSPPTEPSEPVISEDFLNELKGLGAVEKKDKKET